METSKTIEESADKIAALAQEISETIDRIKKLLYV